MGREEDKAFLSKIPKEQLMDFLFLSFRNLWAVDGLYFLEIEKQWGIKAATEIDQTVWEIMGKIEARKLKEFFHIQGNDVAALMTALRYTCWALDLEESEIVLEKNRAVIRNTNCRVQKTRISKGLPEFGCKPVRLGFLKAFAKEFNPEIIVKCTVCPPDKHTETLWCEWEFTLKKGK
jgi:hypothetical protein